MIGCIAGPTLVRMAISQEMAKFGVDCQVFDGDDILFAQRCPREMSARQLADIIRADFERDGWTAAIDAPPATTA
jgi:hypothetical protein